MSDNTIILSENHELVIDPNLKAKSSAVKQMILDGVMGEVDKKDEVDWRDLDVFLNEETELWGFEDIDGEVVIEAKFHAASSFSQGFAAVEIKDKNIFKSGYIKSDESYHIEPKFDGAKDFNEGLAADRKSVV